MSTIYRDEIMPAGSTIDKVGGLNMICINQGPITSNHGFTCECPAGTELQVADGIERCVDIQECKTGQHHCGWLPCRDFCAHGSSDGVQGNAWWNEDYTQCIYRLIICFWLL